MDAPKAISNQQRRNVGEARAGRRILPGIASDPGSSRIHCFTIIQEDTVSELVSISYDSVEQAEAARKVLARLQQDYLVEMEDIVIAERRHKQRVQLHQSVNMVAPGALEGGFLGGLVGLIFFAPLFGIAIGAAAGAAAGALSDYGIDDDYMKQLAAGFDEGKAVLFVLFRKPPNDHALAELEKADLGGEVVRTSLERVDEDRLRQALHEVHASHQASG